jgi:hypothetical protein
MNKKTAFIAVTAIVLMGLGMGAMAADKDGTWAKHHPRRDQVNDRLARQIRQEERDMAAQNGGHITKAEEGVLNQQENAVSKQIGK